MGFLLKKVRSLCNFHRVYIKLPLFIFVKMFYFLFYFFVYGIVLVNQSLLRNGVEEFFSKISPIINTFIFSSIPLKLGKFSEISTDELFLWTRSQNFGNSLGGGQRGVIKKIK